MISSNETFLVFVRIGEGRIATQPDLGKGAGMEFSLNRR